VVQKMMVMSDGAEHAGRRRGAALGLEDHILEKFESKVRASIDTILAEAYAAKKFDFVETVAKRLPSTVLADLFSIPEADRKDFFTWSNQMTAFFGGATTYENPDGIRVNHAATKLRGYFRDLFTQRRSNPGEDYASMLIKAGQRYNLSDDELISQAIMMLVAGSVTTTDQICNCAYLLAANPKIQQHLRAHPEDLAAALEEFKRYDPAVTFLFRVAKTDTLVGNQFIKAGETVFISSHAVNRDPHTTVNPNRLDIRRPMNPAAHFAYGHGAHYCLGAKLGRQQMNLLFHAMLTRFPSVALDENGQTERDHYSLSFSGFKRLDLRTEAC
jgi:cytochrome P450